MSLSYDTSVIFGGTGFIGRHLARHLLAHHGARRVCLVDLRPLEDSGAGELREAVSDGRLVVVEGDVRRALDDLPLPESCDFIANLAAIHREPGHEVHEYFETNLYGARNVCAWAANVGCERLLFTSSIAPYGPSEEPRDESSLPVPVTAYGASKLAAEQIHLGWQNGDASRRHLVIARPGVVFGPGEGGNVTRLIRAVQSRAFAYAGNRGVLKAGGYVKELCRTVTWCFAEQERNGTRRTLYNFGMSPVPTLERFVEEICGAAQIRRRVPRIPYHVLYFVALIAEGVCRPLGIRQPLHPLRVRKVRLSNHVVPRFLLENGYPYHYSLGEALADWRAECPEDWA